MIEFRALRADDNRDGFRSGDVELDRFFHKFAGQNQFRLHIGTTYVAIRESEILGFATVSATSITYLVEIGQEFDKAVVLNGGVILWRGATEIVKVTRINGDTAESEKAKDEAAGAWLRRPVVFEP